MSDNKATLDRIKEIEYEMSRTQKNKATATHLGVLKAKLSKLRRDLHAPVKSTAGTGFDVARTGVARIGFIGFPSVGKSTLLSALTGQYSAIADYEFTTLTTVPGVLMYNNARIQVLDLPGIIEGARSGRGRGKQVLAVARTCSLLLVVLDVSKPLTHKKVIDKELELTGIRLNKSKPDIRINKKDRGGITCINSTLDPEVIKSVMLEYRISNAEIIFKGNCTIDDLIDTLTGNCKYMPCIYVLNKIDKISIEELDILCRVPHAVPICAHLKWNLNALLETSWREMKLIRVHAKPKGAALDDEPVVLKDDACSVENFCNAIHRDIVSKFKYALVWGVSVKHNPQKVGLGHVLMDNDVVQIVRGV